MNDNLIKVKSTRNVAQSLDALEAAVTKAGAKVFARVDHAKGAASVDMPINDAQLLIFGNPALGTPAMQADPLAGLFLPLKMLAYTDADGTTWLVYQDIVAMFDGLNIPKDAEVIAKMQGALGKLSSVAAG